METDIFRQASTWKDDLRKLRDMISSIERQGYSNLNAFSLHLDHQLYKSLEHQYIIGLSETDVWMSDINVDIVFRHQKLQFRPTMEEIRSKYYYQLRKFVEKPENFRGVSDRGHRIFKVMAERNQHHFLSLYEKGEVKLKNLENYKSSWMRLVALGCIDLDETCCQRLKNWMDWDENFKQCKRFTQQIAKILR